MKGRYGEKVIFQIVQAEILTPVTCLKGKGYDHYTSRTLLRIELKKMYSWFYLYLKITSPSLLQFESFKTSKKINLLL